VVTQPGPSLLLVDDSPATIALLAAGLEADYRLFCATNGADAIRLAEQQHPDLILLDVVMPDLDGFAVLQRLRDHPGTAEIPIVFVTAARDIAAEEQGLLLGADDYVTKPVVLPVLRARIRNLLARSQAEARLRLAGSVFQHAAEGILVADENQRIVDVNPALCDITGYSREELIGQTPRLFASGRHDRAFFERLWQALRHEQGWTGEIWNRMKDGTIRPQWLTVATVRHRAGRISHFVALFADIGQLITRHEQLERQAYYDALTGLPNRLLFGDRVRQAIGHAERSGRLMALGLLDLDDFKTVNDHSGHAAGDDVLVEMARRLQRGVRKGDTLARWGGDEFVVLLPQLADVDECAEIGRRLLDQVQEPIDLPTTPVQLTASLGFALCPAHGTELGPLLHAADQAMYQAKRAGKQRYRLFGSGEAGDALSADPE